MLEGILLEGFIYGIMALGVFITFRILDFPDMTVDGSFPMGTVIVASMITAGYHYSTALLVAFAAGLVAGSVTALIHIKLKISNLLAGILTLTMLYSINIRILNGKAIQALLNKHTLMSWVNQMGEKLSNTSLLQYIGEKFNANPTLLGTQITQIFFFLLIVLLVKLLIDLFFTTDMGLVMISMGDNPKMVTNLGINENSLKLIGVSLANGLVGFSGGLAAMYLGFGDVNLGQGIIVSGLASVMLGEFILRGRSMPIMTLRVIIGCIIYKAVMYAGRSVGFEYFGLKPQDLKLLTGLLLIACLASTQIMDAYKQWQRRRRFRRSQSC